MTLSTGLDERMFPRTGSPDEQKTFLLRYAILAPSTHNTQPWKFALTVDGIRVYADYTRRMRVVDPGNRELLMSIGAAIFNLRVAAAHFGYDCSLMYNHSGDSESPIALVSLAPAAPHTAPDRTLDELFPCIVRRHTNRLPFLMSRIPSVVLDKFRRLDEGSRASLSISTDGILNRHVADLVAAGDKMLLADPAFRHDLAEWVRPNWSSKPDGIPGAALGARGIAAALSPWTTKVLDLARLRAATDKNLCTEAPALITVSAEDAVPHWLDAGELLGRILLTIEHEGLQCSYFNMPVQVPELRRDLRTLLGLQVWPQLLLRIGYCLTEPAVTPRRPVEDVLIKFAVSQPESEAFYHG